jgi:hypothetical protein
LGVHGAGVQTTVPWVIDGQQVPPMLAPGQNVSVTTPHEHAFSVMLQVPFMHWPLGMLQQLGTALNDVPQLPVTQVGFWHVLFATVQHDSLGAVPHNRPVLH